MQKKILEILTSAENYVSGQSISEQLGISRQAVWKGIKSLKERGYDIKSLQNKGYKLVSTPEHMDQCMLEILLVNNKIIGKNIIVLDSVGSTNDYLKQLGSGECPNGTVVTTREQVSGKGRLGRVWQSKRDENIAFSVLLRPNMTPSEVTAITPLAGLAVCKAVRDFTGLDCMIKWPNDIVVGRKKIVGILTEMSAEFDAVEYTVTGIGINVDQAVFPEEIAYKATSVLLETGRHFDKNKLLACVLEHLEDEFLSNNLELTPTALAEYSDMCVSIGKSVTFQRGTRKISGMAVGVENDGELKIMLSDGTICNVNSGEVTVQGIY